MLLLHTSFHWECLCRWSAGAHCLHGPMNMGQQLLKMITTANTASSIIHSNHCRAWTATDVWFTSGHSRRFFPLAYASGFWSRRARSYRRSGPPGNSPTGTNHSPPRLHSPVILMRGDSRDMFSARDASTGNATSIFCISLTIRLLESSNEFQVQPDCTSPLYSKIHK